MKFSEIIEEFKLLGPEDKVRSNSRDDYDLNGLRGNVHATGHRQFLFMGGTHIDGDWHVAYGRMTEEAYNRARRNVSEDVGSCKFHRNAEGEFYAIANSSIHIGFAKFEGVTEVPEELIPYLGKDFYKRKQAAGKQA